MLYDHGQGPVPGIHFSGEILTLLQKDAIMRVEPNEPLTGFYSLYFLVPKKGKRSTSHLGPQTLKRLHKGFAFQDAYHESDP